MARKPHPSDLTNTQWRLIEPLIPAVKPGGRPRKYDMREVVNAVQYVSREGCTWRALPHDLPHRKTAYNFFRAFEADGTWDRLVTALRVAVRTKRGRGPTPRGGWIDSRSARTAGGGAEVGVDGGKMVRGRKRHIVTDTVGLLLVVLVTAANCDDGATAPRVLGLGKRPVRQLLADLFGPWISAGMTRKPPAAGGRPADAGLRRVEPTRPHAGCPPRRDRLAGGQEAGLAVGGRRPTGHRLSHRPLPRAGGGHTVAQRGRSRRGDL
jgi:transposase